MSLISLYPDLKQISRGLFELNSSITFRYSYSHIRLFWTPPTPEQKWIGLIFVGLLASIWAVIGVYEENYVILISLGLIGTVIWLRKRSNAVDMHEVRLHNDILVDSMAQQILVEHLNDEYRQQVAKERAVSFRDVKAVRVQASGYAGILFLELADTSKLFLIKVEAENIAQQMAYVLRRVIGLPEPARRTWWPF